MCSVLWSNFKQKKQQQQAQTTTTVATPVAQNDNYKTILAQKSGKSAKQNNVRTISIFLTLANLKLFFCALQNNRAYKRGWWSTGILALPSLLENPNKCSPFWKNSWVHYLRKLT